MEMKIFIYQNKSDNCFMTYLKITVQHKAAAVTAFSAQGQLQCFAAVKNLMQLQCR